MGDIVPWEFILEDGILNAYLHGKLTLGGGLSVPLGEKIAFGDEDTYIYEYSDDNLRMFAGGVEALQIKESGGEAQCVLPQFSNELKPTLSFGTGVGMFAPAAHVLAFSNNGTRSFTLTSTYFYSQTGRSAIMNTLASNTAPNIVPKLEDSDTGVGYAGNDALSLVAGGVEGVRISESAGVITTAIQGVQEFANNAAAVTGGLSTGGIYRTGDDMKIVH